jgi:GTP:adenosylcobinamide-phosphate guanylyltransferase
VNIELTLIAKPGCHLCEDAELAIERVVTPFLVANPSASIEMKKLNILDDAELAARYSEEIPVLLINSKVHNYWRIDEERFATALNALVN